jgi:hypothetical protein
MITKSHNLSTLFQINPIQSLPFHFCTNRWHYLCLPAVISFRFHNQNSVCCLIHARWSTHLTLLDLTTLIIFSEEYKPRTFQVSPTPCYFQPPRPKHLPQHLSLCSPLWRNTPRFKHKTKGKAQYLWPYFNSCSNCVNISSLILHIITLIRTVNTQWTY